MEIAEFEKNAAPANVPYESTFVELAKIILFFLFYLAGTGEGTLQPLPKAVFIVWNTINNGSVQLYNGCENGAMVVVQAVSRATTAMSGLV